MNKEDFMRLTKRTATECQKLIEGKGKEYAHGADVLANFKRGAAELSLPPMIIAAVYARKHWDAIMSYVAKVQEGRNPDEGLTEKIEGRFQDLHNYLYFLSALNDERKKSIMADNNDLRLITLKEKELITLKEKEPMTPKDSGNVEIDRAVLVYGPQGCGKSKNATKIARVLGKTNIIDGWDPSIRFSADSLLLTNIPPDSDVEALPIRIMRYFEAMGLVQNNETGA